MPEEKFDDEDKFSNSQQPYVELDRFLKRKINNKQIEQSIIDDGKKTIYKDYKGNKVKEVILHSDNTTSILYYDSENKITHTIQKDSCGFISYAEVYDKYGNRLSWQDNYGNIYKDENSNVDAKFLNESFGISSQTEFSDFWSGEICLINEYSENSNIIFKQTTIDNIGRESSIMVCNYLYDEHNNLIKKIVYRNNNLEQITYYDVEGKETKITCSDGKKEYSTIIEYDSNGNKIKTTDYLNNKKILRYTIYKYDQTGKIIAEKNYLPDDIHSISSNKYVYNENNQIIKIITEGINRDIDVLTRIYEYDSNNNLQKITEIVNSNYSNTYEWKQSKDGLWQWLHYTE